MMIKLVARHSWCGLGLIGFLSLSSTNVQAKTGDVILSFPSSFASPDGLAWDGKYLWATDCSTSRIDKVDPDTGGVLASIDVPGVDSDELTWDGTALWMSDHTATEMPGTGAPPPALYRVDVSSAQVLLTLAAPGVSKFPMGLGWDGSTLWSVDTQDKTIYRVDPQSGKVLARIPTPARGGCGLGYDGACLWLTDATTDGLVYHLDPKTGEIIRSFDGPGGKGHQATGVAWDGRNLWVHDEAPGRARIYKLSVDDVSEGGRCAGAASGGTDAGSSMPASANDAGITPSSTSQSGCSMAPGRPENVGIVGGLLIVLLIGWFRTRTAPWRA